MAIRNSVAVRNAMAASYEATIGTSPVLQIRTGAPGAPSDAATGTLLASLQLPADWMNNAANGSVTRLGTWTAQATAAGTAGQYRLLDSAGVCHETGIVAMSGGDMAIQNTNIAVGQEITISTWTITSGNA